VAGTRKNFPNPHRAERGRDVVGISNVHVEKQTSASALD